MSGEAAASRNTPVVAPCDGRASAISGSQDSHGSAPEKVTQRDGWRNWLARPTSVASRKQQHKGGARQAVGVESDASVGVSDPNLLPNRSSHESRDLSIVLELLNAAR